MQVEQSGFKKATRENIEVNVSGTIRADIGMQLGEVTQTVEVEAGAPLYAKFGLRNSRPLYPAGAHLVGDACAIAREKVHRAAAALEWLARLRPELVQSEPGAPGLGVPQPAAEGVIG